MKCLRMVCILMAAVLVLPLLLTACTPSAETGPDTAGETNASTEVPTAPDGTETNPADETDGPKVTEPVTEPETEGPVQPELFPEPAPIAYIRPDYDGCETWFTEPAPEPEVHRVEGENFAAKTLVGSSMAGGEFSGGAAFICNYDPASMDDLYIEYTVSVEQTGTYELTALITPTGEGWSCDYWVTVNGGTVKTKIGDYRVLDSFACPTLNDNGVFKVMSLTTVDLTAGENTVRFTLDPNDPRQAPHATKAVLFLDWFEVSLGGKRGEADVSVGYETSPEGADAELLAGAARVSVYDCRYPIRLDAVLPGDGTTAVPWSVTDYYGNILCAGELPAENGTIRFSKVINRHPTGYFTFKVGAKTLIYVVTPPLHTEAYADSPFAMDFASYYLIGSPDRVFDVASAARLMGVTWVRERCDWSTYERTRGTYDFSSTDGVYNAIHRAGLKNLAMLCASPQWARQSYVGSGAANGMIAGFRDHQLDAYRMVKAMAEHYSGIVDGWELWNECDLSGFAIEPADLYASWFKATALAVADAGVKDTVISFGGLCQGSLTPYMSQLMQNNVLDYSHIFNYHQHASYSPSYTTFVYTLMEYMNASAPAYTDALKPMWVTEAGMRMVLAGGSGAPTEAQLKGQCYFIVTSTLESLSYGTDKHYWFVLSPYIENGGDFGTFSSSLVPYPTVAAEAAMTWVLGKGRYIGTLTDVPKGCFGYMFDTGSGMTAAAWAAQSKKNGFKYTFASDYPVTVTDMMGNRTVVEPENGEITVILDRNPIYITYRAAPAFAAQTFPEREIDYNLTVPESGRVILTPLFPSIRYESDKDCGYAIDEYMVLPVRILNLNDHEVTGRVTGSCTGLTVDGSDTVTVPAMSEVTVTVTIQTNTDDNVDTFLRLVGSFGTDGGESVSVSHVYSQTPVRKSVVEVTNPRADDKKLGDGQHDILTAEYRRVTGDVIVLLNGLPYTDFTVEPSGDGGKVNIKADALTPGRYFLSVGVKPASGEWIFGYRTFYIK